MKKLIILYCLILSSSCGPIKVDQEASGKVEGEIVIRHVIDLRTTAEGLFNICDTAFENYTGVDKEEAIRQCTAEQIDKINLLLEEIIKQTQGVSNVSVQ